MREKPDLEDKRIVDLLSRVYGLQIDQVKFLPIGADVNVAKYRVVTKESDAYFLKLRKGNFDVISVVVPHFLHEQGIQQIIPPLKTIDNQLWSNLDAYTCILYPYIEGRNGFEIELTDDQWIDFGAALKEIHSMIVPPVLQGQIPFENYSPHWREMVKGFQSQVEHNTYLDPLAAKMAAEMRQHRDEIRSLMERAEQLGVILQSQSLERVLCHSDIHAGNLLHTTSGALHIIDWDNPILAPKERDLMFIGGGVGGIWNNTRESALFYQGYGEEQVNLTVLTYYRCERIIEDIAEFCQHILLASTGAADRERELQKFSSAFLPDQVVEIAFQTNQLLIAGQKVFN